MTFIANEASVTYPAQSAPDSVDFDILLSALQRVGCISGCAVTTSSLMTLSVAAGSIEVDGIRKTVTSGTVTIGTADFGNPRFDLVVADSSGAKQVRAGTAAANPVYPTLTTNDVALAAVYVPATATTISTAMIQDKRVVLFTGDGMGIYGDGNDGVINFDGTTTRLGLAPSSNTYTLTRDIFLDDGSQLSGSAIIKTAGFRIHCRGTLTIGASASIHTNGVNGSGATAGGAQAAGTLGAGATGGAGGAATTGTAGTGVASLALGGTGGTGGLASGGGTGGGVAAGAASLVASNGVPRSLATATLMMVATGNTTMSKYLGGGGGSGGTAVASSTGGGGGGGGGLCWIAARDISNAGNISSNGGTGGNGSGAGTGAGGGGGGGGGAVVLIYGSYSGAGTLTANGATGGTPQGAGATGATGSNGTVYQIQN